MKQSTKSWLTAADFGLMPYGKPTFEEAQTYYEEAKRFREIVVNKLMSQ